jgi:hypothetical protein
MMFSFPEVVVGSPRMRGGLGIFPLYTRAAADARDSPRGYRLVDEALADRSLVLGEVHVRAAVERVRCENRGSAPVLFIEGQHFAGAKQDRVMNGSALVAGRSVAELPVSCVERGRWHASEAQFRAGEGAAPVGVRRALKLSVTMAALCRAGHTSDQGSIWDAIEQAQQAHGVVSATGCLGDSFRARSHVLARDKSKLSYPEGANGVAATAGGKLISLDLFDRPSTCAQLWPRLVDALALDAIEPAFVGTRATAGPVYDALEALQAASWRAVRPISLGDEARAIDASGLVASMLGQSSRIIHLGAVAR